MTNKLIEKINPFRKSKKEKVMKFIKTPIGAIAMLFILVAGASASMNYIKKDKVQETPKQEKIKQVMTSVLNANDKDATYISTLGVVNAESKIEITATTRGTVRGIFFEVGDNVAMNSTLISLYDNSTLTSLNNAQTNFANMQSNKGATERISSESVNQAETSVKASAESVQAAEIGLSSAKDTLANGKLLREKSNEDTKKNAVVSFYGYMNTILSSLNQVNFLIKAEGSVQMDYVDGILSAKNPSSLAKTQANYLAAKKSYDSLVLLSLDSENITHSMSTIVKTLEQTQVLLDNTLTTLNYTVTSSNFNEIALNAQKSSFSTLRNSVITTQGAAESSLRALENLDLVTKQEIDNLENAVLSAENKLASAKINYSNALISLENVKQGKTQQIISSQTSLDSALGQLNLARSLTSDLTLRAPIQGQITKKNIDLGTDVSPGQVLAEIQQAKTVKIQIDLPSEDIYRIEKDQQVEIGDGFMGMISSIAPAADPITRKVKVEIVYNNENSDLIPGTYIDVKIPTKKLEKTNTDSVFIPLRAIAITQNESYVFIAQGEIAKKVLVVTGKTEGAMIEIINGLKSLDELITDGGKNLEDGEKIEINNK